MIGESGSGSTSVAAAGEAAGKLPLAALDISSSKLCSTFNAEATLWSTDGLRNVVTDCSNCMSGSRDVGEPGIRMTLTAILVDSLMGDSGKYIALIA